VSAPRAPDGGAPQLGDEVPWSNALFDQPWWLDATAPGAWDEVVVRDGGTVVARLPYARRRRLGLTALTQPPLTQTLGPWVHVPGDAGYARRLTVEMELMERLIAGLPRFDRFQQQFSHLVTNWLPFHWAGFSATVRYTYRIEDLTDLDAVLAGFRGNVRRFMRKAAGLVEVRDDLGLDRFLELNAATFRRRGMAPPVDEALVRRLDAACARRGRRRILFAVDAGGRVHAAEYVVWDERATYALMSGLDPELRDSGAGSLLKWEAIRHAAAVSRAFDFEGSVVPSIERFVRAFGGRQTLYLAVSKSGRRLRPLEAARDLGRALAGR
jgi:hypothetical protein